MSRLARGDRPKWRIHGWHWHAMQRHGTHNYKSLCGDVEDGISHGSRTTRPPPIMRCARCDVLEMELAGADESLDNTPGWERS